MSLFITFEGPEGSGKTTQIRLLVAKLESQGHTVLTTREPGGTEIGNAIRDLVLDAGRTEMSPRSEALLFNAARAQLVDEVIRPALAAGITVICDRYGDSTLAYQGYGRGQDLNTLRRLAAFATGKLTPDITFFLDVNPELGLQRKEASGDEEWNRMEEQAVSFHIAARNGYLELAKSEPLRWLVVDACRPIDEVAYDIRVRVENEFAGASACGPIRIER